MIIINAAMLQDKLVEIVTSIEDANIEFVGKKEWNCNSQVLMNRKLQFWQNKL